jgi:hypothetical protein
MKIRGGLVFSASTNELLGWSDSDLAASGQRIQDLLEDDEKAECMGHVATHMLQFTWTSYGVKFQYPVAFHFVDGVTGVQLYDLFMTGVRLLHAFGFRVLCAVCDGAGENRMFQVRGIEFT